MSGGEGVREADAGRGVREAEPGRGLGRRAREQPEGRRSSWEDPPGPQALCAASQRSSWEAYLVLTHICR